MRQDYIPFKSTYGLGLLALKRYVSELSNEILNIDFGLGAAKTSG